MGPPPINIQSNYYIKLYIFCIYSSLLYIIYPYAYATHGRNVM